MNIQRPVNRGKNNVNNTPYFNLFVLQYFFFSRFKNFKKYFIRKSSYI